DALRSQRPERGSGRHRPLFPVGLLAAGGLAGDERDRDVGTALLAHAVPLLLGCRRSIAPLARPVAVIAGRPGPRVRARVVTREGPAPELARPVAGALL